MDFNEIEDENTLKVAKYQLQDDQNDAENKVQQSKTKHKTRNQVIFSFQKEVLNVISDTNSKLEQKTFPSFSRTQNGI